MRERDRRENEAVVAVAAAAAEVAMAVAVVRDIANYFGVGGKEMIKQFNIPKQCPLTRLAMERRKESKTLGKEKGKAMGRNMFCENGTGSLLLYNCVNLRRLHESIQCISSYFTEDILRLYVKD
jgi:hypothetical protein